jgi:hypothetical protein
MTETENIIDQEIKNLQEALKKPNLTRKERQSLNCKIWYRKNKAKTLQERKEKYAENADKEREKKRIYYQEIRKKKEENGTLKKPGRPRKYNPSPP